MTEPTMSEALKGILADAAAKREALAAAHNELKMATAALAPDPAPVIAGEVAPAPAPPIKPGWKTTEFWIPVVGAVIAAVLGAFGKHEAAELVTKGDVVGLFGYILSRGIAKHGAS